MERWLASVLFKSSKHCYFTDHVKRTRNELSRLVFQVVSAPYRRWGTPPTEVDAALARKWVAQFEIPMPGSNWIGDHNCGWIFGDCLLGGRSWCPRGAADPYLSPTGETP